MTALAARRFADLKPGPRLSHTFQRLATTGDTFYNRGITAYDPATGQWRNPAAVTKSSLVCTGLADLGDQESLIGGALDQAGAAKEIQVVSGTWLINGPTGMTPAIEGSVVYCLDDQTFQLAAGNLPILGILIEVKDDGSGNGTGKQGWVLIDPIINAQLAAGSSTLAAGGKGATRFMFTSLGGASTYSSTTGVLTGPVNTALPTQDGVTAAIGDVGFALKNLANLSAAAQAGPWQITGLGSASASWTAVRPPWYPQGSDVPIENLVRIGPEGANFANTSWISTATPVAVVDTTDPLYQWAGAVGFVELNKEQSVRGVVTANIASLAAFTVASNDGLTYVAGNVVLLVNQTTATQNGPYTVGTVGGGTAPLTRPPWWQTGAVVSGPVIFLASEGTQGANSQWMLRTTGAITIDTTNVSIDMLGGNWLNGQSTAVGTMATPAGFFFAGATLKARMSGIFEVHFDIGWSNNTTADPVTFVLVSDTVADGAGAVLASANKVNHGTTGFGTYGTRGADLETVDTNAGATLTFNAAAFNTAQIVQATEVNGTLTGLLTTNGSSTQKFGFHGIAYNATPTGTAKTPFAIGNQVAFGVKVTAAAGTITVGSCRITIKELPAQ